MILKEQILVEEDGKEQTLEVGCVVPLHQKDVAVGTLNNILQQAGRC